MVEVRKKTSEKEIITRGILKKCVIRILFLRKGVSEKYIDKIFPSQFHHSGFLRLAILSQCDGLIISLWVGLFFISNSEHRDPLMILNNLI
jgi:hypothetical protein